MIRVTGTLTCASAEDAAVVGWLLPDHVRLSRAESGCLTFNVDPTSDPLVWRLDESFADRAAFEAHHTRTRASEWFRATAHLGRDYRVAEVPPPSDKVAE
jgi:quinol monooxygenase YgiN